MDAIFKGKTPKSSSRKKVGSSKCFRKRSHEPYFQEEPKVEEQPNEIEVTSEETKKKKKKDKQHKDLNQIVAAISETTKSKKQKKSEKPSTVSAPKGNEKPKKKFSMM